MTMFEDRITKAIKTIARYCYKSDCNEDCRFATKEGVCIIKSNAPCNWVERLKEKSDDIR